MKKQTTKERILEVIENNFGEEVRKYVAEQEGKAYFKRRGWLIYEIGETKQQRRYDFQIKGIQSIEVVDWSATERGIRIKKA